MRCVRACLILYFFCHYIATMTTQDKTQLLYQHIQNCDVNEALAIIATGECDLSYVDSFGRNMLMYACAHACSEDSVKIILALIATGKSNPEYINPSRDNTALIAILNHSVDEELKREIAKALMDTKSCNVHYVSKYYTSALTHACVIGSTELALEIINAGSDNNGANYYDEKNQTQLNYRLKWAAHNNMGLIVCILVTNDVEYSLTKYTDSKFVKYISRLSNESLTVIKHISIKEDVLQILNLA